MMLGPDSQGIFIVCLKVELTYNMQQYNAHNIACVIQENHQFLLMSLGVSLTLQHESIMQFNSGYGNDDARLLQTIAADLLPLFCIIVSVTGIKFWRQGHHFMWRTPTP